MKRSAFTLSEMLTVVVIVITLIAMISIAVGPGIAKSKTQPTCAQNLKQIGFAVSLYVSDYGAPPPGIPIALANSGSGGEMMSHIKCPLDGFLYRDMLSAGGWSSLAGGLKTSATNLPDGRSIPTFDPERDVLARCLTHGFGGFDRVYQKIWYVNPETKGQVLGVRGTGSVEKVAPVSCWECALDCSYPSFSHLWGSCDNP